MTIHIKATPDTDDKIISELMNILINHGFKAEKYLGRSFKIVMARKGDKLTKSKEELDYEHEIIEGTI